MNIDKPKKDWSQKTTKTKVLTVILYILCLYFLIAGFLNIPPASYLSDVYAYVTQTNEYSPTLNMLLLVTPTIIMFRIYDSEIS